MPTSILDLSNGTHLSLTMLSPDASPDSQHSDIMKDDKSSTFMCSELPILLVPTIDVYASRDGIYDMMIAAHLFEKSIFSSLICFPNSYFFSSSFARSTSFNWCNLSFISPIQVSYCEMESALILDPTS